MSKKWSNKSKTRVKDLRHSPCDNQEGGKSNGQKLLDKRGLLLIIFLFLIQNICCWYIQKNRLNETVLLKSKAYVKPGLSQI